MIITSSSCIQCGALNGLSTIVFCCDLVGVAGGRRTAKLDAVEAGTTILGNANDETLRLEALDGDPDRAAFGVRGVIGVNGVIGVIGVIGVTGVLGGIVPSKKKQKKGNKILSSWPGND